MTETLLNPIGDAPEERARVEPAASRAAGFALPNSAESDRLAAGRAAARSLGVPEAIADLDPDEIVGLSRTTKRYRLLSESPHLHQWLDEGNNAELAGDDVEALAAVEHAYWRSTQPWLGVYDALEGPAHSFAAGAATSLGMGAQGLGQLLESSAEGLSDLRESSGVEAEPFGALAPFVGHGYATPGSVDFLVDTTAAAGAGLREVGETVEEMAIAMDVPPEERGFLNDVAGGLGQVAGQLALFAAGPLGKASFVALAFGQGVEVQRRLQIDRGVDPNSAEAHIGQFLAGIGSLVSERISIGALMKRLPSLEKYTGRRLAGTVKGAAVEATQEVGESILQNVIANAVAEQDTPFLDALWKDGLVGGSTGGIVGYLREALVPGRRKGPAVAQPPSPEQDRPVIEAINVAVRESKLAKRSPQALRDFLGRTKIGSGTEHLYVSAEAFLAYFRGQDLLPGSVARQLGLKPGDVVQRAKAGGLIAIPTENYAVTLAATQHGDWFALNASFSPQGVAAKGPGAESASAQARQVRDREEAFLKAEASELAALEQEMIQQFTEAGLPQEVAQQTVQPLVAFYRTLASESVESPAELFRRFGGLEVSGGVNEVERPDGEHRKFGQRKIVSVLSGKELGYDGDNVDVLIPLAKKWYNENLRPEDRRNSLPFSVFNANLGLPIMFEAPEKIRSKRFRDPVRLKLVPALWDIVRFAEIKSNFIPNTDFSDRKKQHVLGMYWGEADVQLGSNIYTVRLNLRVLGKGTKYYNHTVDGVQKNVNVPQSGSRGNRDRPARAGEHPQDIDQLYLASPFDDFNLYVLAVRPVGAASDQDELVRGSLSLPGSGLSPASPARILLTEQADFSTTLHELGHYFLEVNRSLMNGPGAPLRVHQDLEETNTWWRGNAEAIAVEAGVAPSAVEAFLDSGSTSEGPRERRIAAVLHEQWARAFEAYLREGKAPSVELRQSFRHFKDWLIAIYRQQDALGVDLSAEVRGVFDRMLATRAEIEQAARRAGYRDAGDPRRTAALQNFRAEAEEDLLAARLAEEEEDEEAVVQALHGRAALQYLEEEIEGLMPEAGPSAAEESERSARIAAEISKGWTAREMNEDLYLVRQAQAGQAAAAALAAGEQAEALLQRRRQLLNHYLWLEARKKRHLLQRVQDVLRPAGAFLYSAPAEHAPAIEPALVAQ